MTLDASAGRVQLGPSTASGIVTAQGTSGAAATGSLTLTLVSGTLSGRSLAAFDFTGTGTSPSNDASAAAYQVNTGALDLTNATVGSPVEVSGLITPFGAAAPPTTPDFNASTLLDYTTINAALVLDWGGGTPAPFASYNSSQIVLDSRNGSIGARHEIEIGAQTVNIVGIASNPLIVPNATDTNTVYTIGHSVSGTFENFVTYSAFITQLQTELNGTTLATGITASGPIHDKHVYFQRIDHHPFPGQLRAVANSRNHTPRLHQADGSRADRPLRSLRALAAGAPASVAYAYVGTYTPNGGGIYLFRIDRSSGALTQLQVTDDIRNPSWLAVNPAQTRLYAISEIDNYQGAHSGAVVSYAIDADSLRITRLGAVSSAGTTPAHA